MNRYLIQPPWWLRMLYPNRLWRIGTLERKLYLTFDDGPHEKATPFVLDLLAKHNVKASFFCIGKNVIAHPDLYRQILEKGHRVGNHTQHHLNGWKTDTSLYLQDVAAASELIDSNLFRPPYGRLLYAQAKGIARSIKKLNTQVVMWDLLSGDFDVQLSGQDCFENCRRYLRPGSIIVFHDSEKAWDRLSVALPLLLEFATTNGYTFETLP
jgi:peptidoglycan/xylan/chitin deacetylase (PgdA/CDA1 family)